MDESALSASRPDSPNPVESEKVNWLLRVTGIFDSTHVEPVETLAECTPNFFVVLFEHTFQNELPGKQVTDDATSREAQHNMRCILGNLESMIQRPLNHIDPIKVCELDEQHVRRLLRVFLFVVVQYQIGIWNPGSLLEAIDTEEEEVESEEPQSQLPTPQATAATAAAAAAAFQPPGGLATSMAAAVGRSTNRVTRVARWQSSVELPAPAPSAPTGVPSTSAAAAHLRGRRELFDDMARVSHQYRVDGAGPPPPHPGFRPAAATQEGPNHSTPSQPTLHRSSEYTPSTKPLKPTPGLRSLGSGLRDAKIERLRTQKFLEEADRTAAQIAVRRASEKEVELRVAARKDLRNAMKNALDVKKWIKDDDDVYRRVYADLLQSEAAMLGRHNLEVVRSSRDSLAKRAALKEVQALRAARDEVVAVRRSQEEALTRDADRYQMTLTAWRRNSFSRLSGTPLV